MSDVDGLVWVVVGSSVETVVVVTGFVVMDDDAVDPSDDDVSVSSPVAYGQDARTRTRRGDVLRSDVCMIMTLEVRSSERYRLRTVEPRQGVDGEPL